MNRRDFIARTTAASVAAIATSQLGQAQSTPAVGRQYKLPDLPYAYDALEPVIDAKTMEIHHSKHHAGYTSKFNAALKGQSDLAKYNLEQLLGQVSNIKDPKQQAALRNNGGGYWNHNHFWESMAPAATTGTPSQALSTAINNTFGSLDACKEKFNQAAASRFGSGWAWLIVAEGELKIVSTPNQDNPLMNGLVPQDDLGAPILGLDVWEHAYYLNYQNRRGDYANAWWKVVNWNKVNQRFDQLT